MVAVTAGMVKELREATGLGMMECKKALVAADGDFKVAEEQLRIKSGAKASKASGRVTAEGKVSVAIADDKKSGAIVEVNCETDFVAKNEDFASFSDQLAQLILKHDPADVAALSELKTDSGDSVEEARKKLVMKLGENLTIRRFQRVTTDGLLGHYLHGAKIGVLIDLSAGDDALARDLSMHIAASKPKAVDEQGVDAEAVETERRIAIEKAREAGKPEEMLDKIANGTVQKFLKEVTLLGQVFVKAADGKQTVAALLKEKQAAVNGFQLYVVGEGIEKKEEDYAAEVAAAAAAAQG